MQRLAQDREIDRVFLDRRILDVAETVFEILETVLLRQLRAELDHLGRVIDRDDFARGFRQQLRERPLARAEIGHGERREKRDHGVGQRLPGTARAITAAKATRELIEIFARFVLAFAQDDFERGPVALRLRHFAGEGAGQFAHLGPLRAEFSTVR